VFKLCFSLLALTNQARSEPSLSGWRWLINNDNYLLYSNRI